MKLKQRFDTPKDLEEFASYNNTSCVHLLNESNCKNMKFSATKGIKCAKALERARRKEAKDGRFAAVEINRIK